VKKFSAIIQNLGLLQRLFNPMVTNNTEWIDLGPKPYIFFEYSFNIILKYMPTSCY